MVSKLNSKCVYNAIYINETIPSINMSPNITETFIANVIPIDSQENILRQQLDFVTIIINYHINDAIGSCKNCVDLWVG